MTLNIDFTPQETDWINAQAQQQELSPAEVIRKLVDAQVVATPAPTQPTPPPNEANPGIDAENAAAIALLKSWREQDATDDPEEIRKAEEELAEFKRNMNANRVATGERLVYP